MKRRRVYSNLLKDTGNENMTHQFLGIFKTHAANMHNHLIHSAETSTDTQIQNSFLAIRILRYG